MAQATDYNLANQTGADFRAELNEILAASVSLNSGASEPSTMYAHQLWVDTSSNVLKIRNAANNAWLTTGVSITASNTFDINAGTVNGITALSFSSGATVASILDEDNLSSDSATALATQQSIKAYVDSQVTAQDLDITDGSSTIAIDLDSETLSLLGGTGITSTASGNGVTFSADLTSVVAGDGLTGGGASGDVTLAVGVDDSSIEINSDALRVKASGITNAMLGGSIANNKLANSSVTINAQSLSLGGSVTLNTDVINEGSSNLYYTDARFDTRLASKTTSNLTEGSNLYYADSRARAAISENSAQLSYNSGTGVLTYTQGDTDTVSEGSSNLYYTDARANSAIDARVTNTFINNLSGVVADTATALATARTIALSGDVAGSVSFDGTSDVTISSTIQANSVALGTDTVGNYVATITGTANKVSVSGSGSETAGVTLSLPDDVQIADSLTVAGNLTVNGDLTYLDTTNLKIEDNLFELNANLTGSPVNDSGMLINRGNQNNGIFMWDESADKFTMGLTTADGTSTGNITLASLGTLVANLEGNVTGNVTGQVSDISNFTTANLTENTNLYYTDARVQAVSINNVVEDTSPQLGGDLASNGNDILFADNDKAIFGAGSDLQIYHDGSDSYIKEDGNGNLIIAADDFRVTNVAVSETMISADTDGVVKLYYDNATKLATTSTGIQVTGNIANTSGDLTLDVAGDIILDADGGEIFLKDGGTTFGELSISGGQDFVIQSSVADKDILLVGTDGASIITALTLDMSNAGAATFNAGATFGGNSTATNQIATTSVYSNNGVFYGATTLDLKDSSAASFLSFASNKNATFTGTAQATRLGLGVAPHSTAGLNITSTNQNIRLNNGSELAVIDLDANGGLKFWSHGDGSNNEILFYQGSGSGSEVMRINGSGRVGISTSSPNANLHVGSASATGDTTNPALQIGGASTYRLGMYTSAEGAVIENKNGDDGIQFRVKTAGEAMRINGGTGNVGIGGSSSLDNKLELLGNLRIRNAPSNNPQIKFNNGDVEMVALELESGASGVLGLRSNAVNIDASGNVGIATTSPASPLHVKVGTNQNLEVDSEGSELRLSAVNDVRSTNPAMRFQAESYKFYGAGGAGPGATIDSSGNVGIGTASPVNYGTGSQGLTINGTGNYQNLNLQVNGTTQFLIYTNGTSGTFINQVTADPMMFYTSDTERMRIDASGKRVNR